MFVLMRMRWHISGIRDERRSQLKNLEYLVLSLKVLVLIWITIGKLVDVDPELLDLLSDLENMDAHTETIICWIEIEREKWSERDPEGISESLNLVPSSSFCRPLRVSDHQLWPKQELCWLFHARPSYTPHPEVEDYQRENTHVCT